MISQLNDWQVLEPYRKQAENQTESIFKTIQKTVEWNQWKVLQAFRQHQVGEHHFTPTTGYGYDDQGRETLEQVYGSVFGTEAAIVRPQVISGTHAIASCLFGILRPGDELIYITGKPYDTLDQVIGDPEHPHKIFGSLSDFKVDYQHIPLTSNGRIDHEAVQKAISKKTKMIAIQRSRGYADRPSFHIHEIQEAIQMVRRVKQNVVIFVDNCYGEFVEKEEPTQVGADLMAGSLIKNPGGGLVKSGGYIVGKKKWVERVGTRLFAPGIGLEGGASLYSLMDMYQGLFMAPHTVGEALKGAIFSSAILEGLGFLTHPSWQEPRTDLIQTVHFETEEKMIAFCQGIQKAAPINSHVTPYPSAMPGYDDPVIMAAGTFVDGASIEFSADGPIRPPYTAYVQGGLTYEHVKLGIMTALHELIKLEMLQV